MSDNDNIYEAALVQREKSLALRDDSLREDLRNSAQATIEITFPDGKPTREYVDGVLATAFNMGILLARAIEAEETNEILEDLATLVAFGAWEIAAIYAEQNA